jgi:O-antigen ligase
MVTAHVSLTQLLAVSFSVIILGVAYAHWSSRRVDRGRMVTSKGVWISWLLLTCHLLISNVSLQIRQDPRALLTEGLSVQNKIQVGSAAVCFIWSAYLLLTGSVRMRAVASRGLYWAWVCFAVLLSTLLYSTWPTLTAFRLIELLALTVIGAHIFLQSTWARQLQTLSAVLCLTAALTAYSGVRETSSGAALFGVLRSNNAGCWAGISLLIEGVLQKVGVPLRRRFPIILGGAAVFFASGSLSSVVALSVAAPLVFVRMSGRRVIRYGTRTALVLLLVGVFGAGIIVTTGSYNIEEAFLWRWESVWRALGKDIQQIATGHGRTPLWAATIEATSDEPFGAGYCAGERVVVTGLITPGTVGWSAAHAHNGYLSAWLSAGWLGVLSSVMMLLAPYMLIGRVALRATQSLLVAGATYVIVHNVTLPLVGASVTPVWIFLLALLSVPTTTSVSLRSVRPQPVMFQRPLRIAGGCEYGHR